MKTFLLLILCTCGVMYPMWGTSQKYDPYEVSKIKDFLKQASAVDGKTNAAILNVDMAQWDVDDSWLNAVSAFIVWSNPEDKPKDNPKKVTRFDLSLTTLSGGADFSGFTKLEAFQANSNKLRTLNLSGCLSLKFVYCNYNELTSLDLSGCPQLSRLECTNNQLRFSTTKFPPKSSLASFTIHFYPQSEIEYGALPLTNVDLNSENIDNNTEYHWFQSGNALTEGVNYSREAGLFSFDTSLSGASLTCKMINPGFGPVASPNSSNSLILTVQLLNATYNEADVNALKAFLTQNSAIPGKLNAEQLGLTPDDLSTPVLHWASKLQGLTWYINDDNKLAVTRINWADKNLAGELDLTACQSIMILDCKHNALTKIQIGKVAVCDVSGNQLKFSTLKVTALEALIIAPQAVITGAATTCEEGVDLSSEYAPLPGLITAYQWYVAGSELPVELSNITAVNGRFTFDASLAGKLLVCKMTNSGYGELTLVYTVQLLANEVTTSNVISGKLITPERGTVAIYKMLYDGSGKPKETVYLQESALASGDNSFIFDNLPEGDYIIVADAAGYISGYYSEEGIIQEWNKAQILRIPSAEAVNLNISLEASQIAVGSITIKGRVIESQTNLKARPSRTMYLQQKDGTKSPIVIQVETNEDGTYEFTNLPPDTYVVSIDEAGYITISTHTVDATTENTVYGNLDFLINSVDKEITAVVPTISWDPETDGPQLNVYPNPFMDMVHISGLNGAYTIKLLNVLGKVVTTGSGTAPEQIFNTSDLAPGMYVLRVESKGKVIVTRKLIKK